MIDSVNYWMDTALAEAREAFRQKEVPVGAVVVLDGVLLGKGFNRTRSLADPTAHAEIIAITAACQAIGSERLKDADIYVTLEPCVMCAGAIVLARISRLYFGVHDQKAGGCGSVFDIVREPRLNHLVEVYPGIHADEAHILLDEFFKELRDKNENSSSQC
ncbi:nucleoside deaminase [bacterium]|nr:nucleoside deaminase [bacterium]